MRFTLPVPRRVPGDLTGTLAFAAAVVGPLVLYVVTLPRTVVLEDDGLFLMAGASLGVAHPPGYPLHTLICHLFLQLPGASPAFLGHLSSAVLGAFACGAVYICARLLGASMVPALTAAWLFGASEHVWSQAIITEVYTLNALLFFALHALLLHGVRHPDRDGIWFTAVVVYGLSLANHWPLMVLATPGLAVAAFPAWRMIVRQWPRLLAGFLPSVALPYAWMVWRSHQNPLLNFYGPIDSLQELWFYISRSGYSHVDTSPSAGWSDRLQFLQWLGHEVVWQLTLPGFVLAVVGLWILLHRREWVMAGSGLLAFLGNSVALVVLLGFDFDFYNTAIFRPYVLVCYGLVVLWLTIGFQFVLDRLSIRLPVALGRPAWLKSCVAALAGAGMAVLSVQAHWQPNDRAGSNFTQRYAETIFDLLPQDAVLFTHGDTDSSPLGYYRFVENHRSDLTLLNTQALVFGNRLYDWRLPEERKREVLQEFVNKTERPVFFTSGEIMSELGFGVRYHGFVKEIVRTGTRVELALIPPQGERYFEELLSRTPNDRWERSRSNKLIYSLGKYLGLAVLSGDATFLKRLQHALALAEQNFYSLMSMAETLLEHGEASHYAQIEAWLEQAKPLQDETLGKERLARFLYLQGFLRHRRGETEEARALFKESRAIYPHPENASINALRQLTAAP